MGRIVGLEFNDSDEIIVTEEVEPEAALEVTEVEPEAALEVTEVEPEAVEKKGSK